MPAGGQNTAVGTLIISEVVREATKQNVIDFWRNTSQKRDQTYSAKSSRITSLDIWRARVRGEIAFQVVRTSRAIRKK